MIGPGASLADLILITHVAIVLFVVGGQAMILVGAIRGWRWVRQPAFRVAHLLLIGWIVLQTWLGGICPLTDWEMALRARAGDAVYSESFVEHWLGRLLYIEAPWSAFVIAYTVFGLLVLASWWWVPPRRRR